MKNKHRGRGYILIGRGYGSSTVIGGKVGGIGRHIDKLSCAVVGREGSCARLILHMKAAQKFLINPCP